MDIDYRKILIAYVNGVLEAEGVYFSPDDSLTPEEEIAWCEAVLDAGVNEHGEKLMRNRIEFIRKQSNESAEHGLL